MRSPTPRSVRCIRHHRRATHLWAPQGRRATKALYAARAAEVWWIDVFTASRRSAAGLCHCCPPSPLRRQPDYVAVRVPASVGHGGRIAATIQRCVSLHRRRRLHRPLRARRAPAGGTLFLAPGRLGCGRCGQRGVRRFTYTSCRHALGGVCADASQPTHEPHRALGFSAASTVGGNEQATD
jgi:hypothetical protein